MLRAGHRPQIPAVAHLGADLESIILECWRHKPDARPPMAEVRSRLRRWCIENESSTTATSALGLEAMSAVEEWEEVVPVSHCHEDARRLEALPVGTGSSQMSSPRLA